jgi:hypothetical protein
MPFIGLAVLQAASVDPADRAAVPQFDTVAYCQKIASVGGHPSYTVEVACRDMEADARKELQRRAIPARVYDYCEKIALVGGFGSYQVMNACVDMELQAARRLERGS